jgi:hypothetical protein
MPPEPSAFNTGLPQVFDTAGKSYYDIGWFTDSSSTSIYYSNYCAANSRRFPDAFGSNI